MPSENTSKFLTGGARAVQLISLACTLLLLFWGFYYTLEGNSLIAGVLSIAFLVPCFFVLDYFIKEKAIIGKRGYPPFVKLAIIVYLLVNLPIAFFAIHALNVEFQEKRELVNGIHQKTEALTELKTKYDNIIRTDSILRKSRLSVLFLKKSMNVPFTNAEKTELTTPPPYPFSSETLDGITALTKDTIITIYMDIRERGFHNLSNSVFFDQDSLIGNALRVVDGWIRWDIDKEDKILSQRIDSNYNILSRGLDSKIPETWGRIHFDPTPYQRENLLNKPIELFKKHLSPIYLLIALIFEFMLILPWLIAPGRSYNKQGKNMDQ